MESFKKGLTFGKLFVISALFVPILYYIVFDNFIHEAANNNTARLLTYGGLGIYFILISFFINFGRKFLFSEIYIKNNCIFVRYHKKIIRQTLIRDIKQIVLINGFIFLCTNVYDISKKNQKKLYGEIYFIVDLVKLKSLLQLVESNADIIYKTTNKSVDEVTKLFIQKCN